MKLIPLFLLLLMVVAVALSGCSHPFYPTKQIRIDTNFGTIKVHGKLLKASWRF